MAGERLAGRAVVEIGARERMQKGLAAAQKRLRAFAAGAAKIGAGLGSIGTGMLTPFVKGIRAASDLEETMNKFNVVFGDNSEMVKAWGDEFAGQVGRSKKQIADFMAGSQDLFVPLGFDDQAATDMSKQVTQLSLDLASFNNMADADTLRDLHAALTGSGEVMKKYGVIVSEAAVKQELLNQGMDPKTVTDQQKVQARLNIIMRGTTAAQGDAIRSAGSFANQMKALSGASDDAFAALGTAVLPVVTSVVQKFVAAAKVVGAFIEKNAGLVRMVAIVAAAITAAGGALLAIAGIAYGASIALGALSSIIGIIAATLGAILSPVGLVVAAITAAAVAFFRFTDSGREMASGIMSTLGEMAEFAKGVFGGITDALSAGDLQLAGQIAMAGLKVAFAAGLDQLRGLVGDTVANAAGQLLSGDLSGAWTTVVTGMAAVWASFEKGVIDSVTAIADAFVNAWEAAVNAISDKLLELSSNGTLAAVLEISSGGAINGEDFVSQLGLDVAPEDLREAQSIAQQITGGQADAVRDKLEAARDAAAAQEAAAAAALVENNTAVNRQLADAAEEARKELDALLEQASQAAQEAASQRNAALGGGGANGEGVQRALASVGGFDVNQIDLGQFRAESQEEKTRRLIEDGNEIAKETLRWMRTNWKSLTWN